MPPYGVVSRTSATTPKGREARVHPVTGTMATRGRGSAALLADDRQAWLLIRGANHRDRRLRDYRRRRREEAVTQPARGGLLDEVTSERRNTKDCGAVT